MSVHYLKHCRDCVDNKLILDDDCDWLVDRIVAVVVDYKRNMIAAVRVCGGDGRGAWPIGRAVLEFRGLKRTNGYDVCHLSDNPLDCESSNLIYDTKEFNNQMKGPKPGSTSQYKCVCYVRARAHLSTPWIARIQLPGSKKKKSLGYFATEDEAGLAYNRAVRQAIDDGVMSPLAYLNPIPEPEGGPECQTNVKSIPLLSLRPEMRQ